MKKLPLTLIFIIPLLIIFEVIFNLSPLYAREEINNKNFEEFEEIEINSENSSLFCTDFNVEYSKESKESVSLSSQPKDDESPGVNGFVSGAIEIEKDSLGQPDFSLMKSRLENSLPNFLPQRLSEEVEIEAESLQTQARHYLIGEGEACPIGEEEAPIPKTNVELPSWWGNLIGQTKIFCGIFNACEPSEKLKIKVSLPEEKKEELFNQLDLETNALCLQRDDFVASENPTTDTNERNFKSCSLLSRFISYVGELIDNLFQGEKTTKEESQLVNKTRGYLLGGKDFTQQSSFFKDFIPHDINSLIEDSPLETDVTYNISGEGVSFGDDEENANKMNFQEQNEVRTQYCLHLCSLYPPDPKFDISTIDPICISCDPKDYQL